MVHPCNMSCVKRSEAILNFCELAVRNQLPDPDDSESDHYILEGCMSKYQSTLKTLAEQAAAGWTQEFTRVLGSAHSLRTVRIERGTEKDRRRQRPERCDACGRREKLCSYAFDLGGGTYDPQKFLASPEKAAESWPEYIKEYQACFDTQSSTRGLHHSDMGRYYLGMTCHRKAKLCFTLKTQIPELMYNAWIATDGMDEAELAAPVLHTVDEGAAEEHLERQRQLELGVAQDKGEVPDVLEDKNYWSVIDDARDKAGAHESEDKMIRKRAQSLIQAAKTLQNTTRGTRSKKRARKEKDEESEESDEDDEDDDEFIVDDEDYNEEDNCSVVTDEDAVTVAEATAFAGLERGERRVLRPRKQSRGAGCSFSHLEEDLEDEDEDIPLRRRHGQCHSARGSSGTRIRVIDDGDDEPGADQDVALMESTAPPTDMQDRGEVRQHDDCNEERREAGADVDVDVDEDEERPDRVTTLQRQPARRQPPPSAIREAAAMRIPAADGSRRLGSRKEVVVSLIGLLEKLTREGRDGDAAVVTRAVLTLQETIEIAKRARGADAL